MRALNDPNAFPHSDLILLRAAAEPGSTLTPKQLLARAELWQPWRAYTVILLWRHYASTHKKVIKKQAIKKQTVKKQAIKRQSIEKPSIKKLPISTISNKEQSNQDSRS